MEENRFFKLVWRFNGLIISIVGVLGVGALLFATYKVFQDVTRDRSVTNIVEVEGSEAAQAGWRLGQIGNIHGADYIMVPLHSDQSFSRAYFSKSSISIRNYLFINTATFESKWLFEHSNYLIERSDRLRFGGYDSKQSVSAILYQIVKIDSDQNNLLTKEDHITIAVTDPNGMEYREILNDIESLIDHTLIDKHTLFLVYEKDAASYSAAFDLDKKVFTYNKRVPNVGD
jgi:hypothetical protein